VDELSVLMKMAPSPSQKLKVKVWIIEVLYYTFFRMSIKKHEQEK